jgi:hypothetical protein
LDTAIISDGAGIRGQAESELKTQMMQAMLHMVTYPMSLRPVRQTPLTRSKAVMRISGSDREPAHNQIRCQRADDTFYDGS